MLVPVILSGGDGTRLWPVSRKSFPKQFIRLVDPNYSLLQTTSKRLETLSIEQSGCIVVTNNEHRFLVGNQLAEVNADVNKIILEPFGRNTAPAIALAAFEALKISNKAKLLVQKADHIIPNSDYFCDLILTAFNSNQPLVTFGIVPTRPETGYGYIEVGSNIQSSDIYSVKKFIEKPTSEKAKEYIRRDNHLWNSGIFLLDAKTYLDELKYFAPEVFKVCELAIKNSIEDQDFVRIKEESFNACPNISIDYAVMEHSKNVSVIPFNSKWLDLGAWDSVLEEIPTDENGNAVLGDAITLNTFNTLVRSESRLVATLGVKDLLITETPDVVLVCRKNSSQDIKLLVEMLRNQDRKEADEHVLCYRPWGSYQSIIIGEHFQVKKIIVKPQKSLSLQFHKYRSEHWVVVKGTADVINGEKNFILPEGHSTFIPSGVKHRLTNARKTDLIIVEVQIGSYLGEDDITRLKDNFGRTLENY